MGGTSESLSQAPNLQLARRQWNGPTGRRAAVSGARPTGGARSSSRSLFRFRFSFIHQPGRPSECMACSNRVEWAPGAYKGFWWRRFRQALGWHANGLLGGGAQELAHFGANQSNRSAGRAQVARRPIETTITSAGSDHFRPMWVRLDTGTVRPSARCVLAGQPASQPARDAAGRGDARPAELPSNKTNARVICIH